MKIIIFVFLLLFSLFLGYLFYVEKCNSPISKLFRAHNDVVVLTNVVGQYHREKGSLPIHLDELAPTYLRNLSNDPWGNPYLYQIKKDNIFQIFSLGADNSIGGHGANSDIYVNSKIREIALQINEPLLGCH